MKKILIQIFASLILPLTAAYSQDEDDSKDKIRILAVGASLTAGYIYPPETEEYQPYTLFMEQLLEDKFGSMYEFDIRNIGVPGYTTSDVLEEPIYPDNLTYQQNLNLEKWDIIFYLLGTNDIGQGRSPELIMKNLEALYNSARRLGSNPIIIPISIPETAPIPSKLVANRNSVNRMMKSYVDSSNSKLPSKKSKAIFFDLNSLIPYDVSRLWSDGLHFTAAGYKKMGGYAYQHVEAIMVEKISKRLIKAIKADPNSLQFNVFHRSQKSNDDLDTLVSRTKELSKRIQWKILNYKHANNRSILDWSKSKITSKPEAKKKISNWVGELQE